MRSGTTEIINSGRRVECMKKKKEKGKDKDKDKDKKKKI